MILLTLPDQFYTKFLVQDTIEALISGMDHYQEMVSILQGNGYVITNANRRESVRVIPTNTW